MAQTEPRVGAIFLSASVPDSRRDPRYFKTASVINIRDAVCTLAELVLPFGELVFGGHPAISPMVCALAVQLKRLDAMTIYQSEFFRAQIPPTTLNYGPRIRWTPAMPQGRDASLTAMRTEMICQPALASPKYAAGFFIGGMEGVEEELELFRRCQPSAAFWPLATTGAAARLLFDGNRAAVLQQSARLGPHAGNLAQLLEQDLSYRRVIRALLGN